MKTKMVSMRMNENLIEDVKKIADKLKTGYQTYLKQEIAKIVARDKKKYG